MKKLQFLSYLFAALFMVTMVSCDDDDDEDDVDPNPSNTELLTAGVWTGDKLFYNGTDVTEMFEDIVDVKTTTVRFNTNGTYSASFSGEPEETGTWEFANNETQLVMDADTENATTVDINELSSSALWIEGDFDYTEEEDERVEIRFRR